MNLFNNQISLLAGSLTLIHVFTFAAEPEPVDFIRDVKPILELNCVSCHREDKAKGKLRLDNAVDAFKSDEVIVKGKPEDSLLYVLATLPTDDDDVMPPQDSTKSFLLPNFELDILKRWIAEGAKWPKEVTLQTAKRLPKTIDFAEHIQPILEFNCVRCHREENAKGKLRLDNAIDAFKSDEVISKGKPLASTLYTLTILDADDDDIMPPEPDEPLTVGETWLLRRWIQEGANWPEDIKLLARKKQKGISGITPQELYKKLGFKLGPVKGAFDAFTQDIPQTEITFGMTPIPAGTYKMGSPSKEAKRAKDEPEPHDVQIGAFWMGTHEVTWDEYELWMIDIDRTQRQQLKKEADGLDLLADGVTRPTPPYTDMSFGMGKDGYPAICMTQLAARVYCMWISAKTGRFYRLPTEAEWEYACRAGTTTAYYFGNDPKELKNHGWFFANSRFQYQPIGKKPANPWGLYDMHGNVWEWCLDQYVDASGYKSGRNNPLLSPTKLYPRLVKGGGWDDDPDRLRSAARLGSDPTWKQQDPQIPKSVWYHTDAHWAGFRLVRPRKIPPVEDIEKYWPTLKEMVAIPDR
ncbi:MAG: SUMF1/EgtB/PvdO family nonheme iron enzyme [Opitutae bacterium]|nr:SUMF1/EgtB/PvdO family nonheme iron enzyme [Opitutae bacterium]